VLRNLGRHAARIEDVSVSLRKNDRKARRSHCRELRSDFLKVSWQRGAEGFGLDKKSDPKRTHMTGRPRLFHLPRLQARQLRARDHTAMSRTAKNLYDPPRTNYMTQLRLRINIEPWPLELFEHNVPIRSPAQIRRCEVLRSGDAGQRHRRQADVSSRRSACHENMLDYSNKIVTVPVPCALTAYTDPVRFRPKSSQADSTNYSYSTAQMLRSDLVRVASDL
jgi:hypothetical protein